MNKAATASQDLPAIPAARIDFSAEDRQWIADRIQEVLASGRLTLGQYGEEFEKQFAAATGARHAVAVNSGTSALEIVFRALDIAERDVLVPTNTNFATAEAVIRAGGRPVLTDMDAESFGTSPEEIEKRITPNTAGIVVVHIGGIVSARMPELKELADHRGLWLVEDAAHAQGSFLGDTHAGTFGIAGTFSFYPTKVMTSAEGGMIVTRDDRIAAEARIYRDQGKESFTRNLHVRNGYNWRLSEPHAIIGLRHMQRVDEMIGVRRRMAAIYDAALRESRNVRPLAVPADGVCNYYKYIVVANETPDRPALKSAMRAGFNVSLSGEVYEVPIHQQPIFEQYATDPFPVADDLCARHLCLPVYGSMTELEAERVIDALDATLG